jgi:acyl carrier protein
MNGDAPQAELLARIAKVFRQTFGAQQEFSERLGRTDVARWTSLRHVEFIIALEREFGLRFDGADATDMVSIAAVNACIARRLEARRQS